jgi:CheY-like chemotaxis protein
MIAAAAFIDASERPLLLLVEDHIDTRQMYAVYLSGEFEVIEAGDVHEALELMKGRRPAILITDLSLPGLDGFELIAMVRKNPDFASMPVICLSGYGGHAHDAQAKAVGCDRMIQKPCMPDALEEAAMELVRASGDRS